MAIKQLDEFDFGFTAVSEDELKAMERQLQQQVDEKHTELEAVSRTYEEKLTTLYRMVMPLLNNLAKDADKDYIFWPGRQKKMLDFIKKVEALVNDR
jgi:glucose-6-phosphate-specific signal transduction histidine kinase